MLITHIQRVVIHIAVITFRKSQLLFQLMYLPVHLLPFFLFRFSLFNPFGCLAINPFACMIYGNERTANHQSANYGTKNKVFFNIVLNKDEEIKKGSSH